MKKSSFAIFFQILKNSGIWKAFTGYLLFFLIIAIMLLIVEPTIGNLGDALWYAFVSCTTIGFGDFAATGFIGRILTVILYVYTVLIIALLTAAFTQFFMELAKAKYDESVAAFQYDLEHLEDLPKERLEEMSRQIRELRKE